MEADETAQTYLRGRKGALAGIVRTGIRELDDALGGGFARGEMVVVGARPSHGKTALALQLLSEMSRREAGLLFSEEMSFIMLGKRLCHQIYGTPIPDNLSFDPGRMGTQWDMRWADRKSVICFESQRTISKLVATAKKYARFEINRVPRVIVVDYLQLLKGEGRTRYEQITDVSMALRALTNHLQTAVIVCAQLSRKAADQPTTKQQAENTMRMPGLSDLRESGQIEQDADVVLLLQWPWMIDRAQPKWRFRIRIAKNRNRAIVHPEIIVAFDAERQTFMSVRDYELRADPNRS